MPPDAPAPGTPPMQPAAPAEPQLSDHGSDFLKSVPEEHREIVAPYVTQWDKGFQKKWNPAQESLKSWEPYQQLGVQDVDPNELSELLALREIFSDPDQLADWYEALGTQLGLYQQQQQPQGQPQGEPQGLTEESIKAMLGQMFDERLGPLEQSHMQQQEQMAMTHARDTIVGQLQEIEAEHGELNEQQRDTICQLALAYADPESGETGIAQGFADYSNLIAAAERDFLGRKDRAPDRPVNGGAPNTSSPPITQFKDANAAALERLRNMNAV